MPYSLWRNDELLAELVVPFPTSGPDTIAGMLRPTAAFTDIGHLMQARVLSFHGKFEQLDSVGGPQESGPARRAQESGPVALQPMTPDQAAGIPANQRLELRNDHGDTVPCDMIMIDPIEIPDGAGEFPDACRAAKLSGRGWTIVAHRSGRIGPLNSREHR